MDNVIVMKNITKNFNDKKALRGLNFEIKPGEIFGFLGPSGAGKTTTIKMLTSQLLPSSGEGKVLNEDIYSLNRNIFKHIGVLTDTSGIYERLSVYENLQLFAKIYDIDEKYIDEVLEKVSLLKDKKTKAKKLSKGMKQRLLLARGVLNKPSLLFLDEPTSSLDPGTSNEIHKLLKELNKNGTTIFLTTHNMEEADKLCHRVAFLNEGTIVEMNTPFKLKQKYAEDYIEVRLKGLNDLIVIKNDETGGEKITNWMKSGQLLSIHSKEPNLEEIFLKLTGREL
jgi:ABC-2 type transport system ATP-binding protein